MTGEYFSLTWTALAPRMANHLWQSTLFAIAAGLLTLLLRKHHARARHWLWLAASLKFLVPFSLLVSIGSRLSPEPAAAPSVRPVIYFAMEEISQPFSQLGVRVTPAHAPSIASSILPQLTQAIGALWVVGFLAVLVLWCVRWHRVSAATKHAVPLQEGREVEVLRRMERMGGIRRPLAMLLSRTSLEPGIFGITRPVLVWPEGISHHLDDQHLEAILAHEVWHVRRRDNLFAALHMLVEAVFWFYPLVWWLGARLIDERERACDEEVVALGKDRQIYAESILKVCEFCLGSPLPYVSGVTGADLKRRMVHIMNDRISLKLDFARKTLLTLAAILAIAVPIAFGVLHPSPGWAQSQLATAPAPVYSSVSIKPSQSPADSLNRTKMMFSLKDGSFIAKGVTLQKLVQMAYHLQDSQISGGPDWLYSAKFDIEAKFDDSVVTAMHQQTADHKNFDDQAMLKALLSEHFQLAMHPQTQTLPAYDLVVDEGGPKLQKAKAAEMHMMHMERGVLTASGTPIEHLAQQLSLRLGQTVVDKTGLKGDYAFALHWTPDAAEDKRLEQGGEGVRQLVTVHTTDPGESQFAKLHAELDAKPLSPDPNAPPLLAALQEQLGLKLVPETEPIQVLVIDHAEAPSTE